MRTHPSIVIASGKRTKTMRMDWASTASVVFYFVKEFYGQMLLFVISGWWVWGGGLYITPFWPLWKSDPRPVKIPLRCWSCIAQWIWEYWHVTNLVPWTYFWTFFLQLCLPVTTSLSILGLLIPICRRPPDVTLLDRVHICCHIAFPPNQWSQAWPPTSIPTATRGWVCVPQTLRISQLLTGPFACVLSHYWHWLFSYRMDSFIHISRFPQHPTAVHSDTQPIT